VALRKSGDPVRRSRIKLVLVAVVGSAITLVGVALLALPGPGFLLVAAGLAILATQFAWARKPLRYAQHKAEQGVDEIAKSRWRTAFAVVCGLVPLTTGVLALTGVEVPVVGRFLNTFAAVSLIVSGLFLVGLVVYARRSGGVGDDDGDVREDLAADSPAST
jgi:uncharacterized protein (TIGR02611 family)